MNLLSPIRLSIFLISAFLVTTLTAPAQTIQSFDEGWKFHFGHTGDPSKDFNYGTEVIFSKTTSKRNTASDPSFKDSAWRNLDLPHDWAVELPFVKSTNFDVAQHGYKPVGGLFPETSIGWYRKHFKIDQKDSGQRISLQFDGVFRDAQYWINGFYLGNHKSGYTGVVFDITDFIQYNKDNVIVVRVDATQYEGWFYEGAGIYRSVWLRKKAPLHVADDGVFVTAAFDKNKAHVTNRIEIENLGEQRQVTLQTVLYTREGKPVASSKEQSVLASTGQLTQCTQLFDVKDPHRWTIEDPYLYRLETIIKNGDAVVDVVKQRFGFRTIEIKPTGVFLNGQHVKIYGTNNHQDHAGVGSAIPEALQYYRIGLLKEMGSNAYRTSHHPPTPALLDACDSLGMLVLDETRLLNSGSEYMEQFKYLLKRDRSRTCVFMWSIGNEEGYVHTNAIGKRIAQTMIQVQQEMDPTRICTYAADVANVYKGINEVIPVRGFNYREYGVADYHRDHPDQPILGTEMGSTVTTRGIYQKDTVRCYVPDRDEVAPWWASRAETWWKLAAANDYWLGGFIWTGFDYRGEPTPYEWPNISSHFGVMDVCGFPKNIYYYYKSWWSNKDVLHVLPHWNWKGDEGKIKEVWVFSNADSVQLFLNETSMGMKEMPRNGHLQWDVPYAPGQLKAIGYKQGKHLQDIVETTDKPMAIMLQPSKGSLHADGNDVVTVTITAFDKEQRLVPDANDLISFTLKGDAKIIGVGNGDPSCHEPDKYLDGQWQRSLFNGKCQVILQAGKTPGTIMLEARSGNLEKASVILEMK